MGKRSNGSGTATPPVHRTLHSQRDNCCLTPSQSAEPIGEPELFIDDWVVRRGGARAAHRDGVRRGGGGSGRGGSGASHRS